MVFNDSGQRPPSSPTTCVYSPPKQVGVCVLPPMLAGELNVIFEVGVVVRPRDKLQGDLSHGYYRTVTARGHVVYYNNAAAPFRHYIIIFYRRRR